MGDTLTQMDNMAQNDATKSGGGSKTNNKKGFTLPDLEAGKVRIVYTGWLSAPKLPNLSANREDIKFFYPVESYDEDGNAVSYYDLNKDTAIPNLVRETHFALLSPASLVCNFRDVNGYYANKKVEAISAEKALALSKEKEAGANKAMESAKERGKKLDDAQEVLRNAKKGEKK